VKVLIFDPFAGISGDMAVAALLDLGLPEQVLEEVARGIGVPGIGVVTGRVLRGGISCRRVEFSVPHQARHRHLADVLEITEASPLAAPARQLAASVFQRLAEAEAEVHGVPVEQVHFHEVGALDSILDILCFAAGVTELGFEAYFTRPVMAGQGWVEMEHGRFPLPAPATLKLLRGLPIQEPSLPGECTTPTGAALLAALVQAGGPEPGFVAGRSGFGAGTRDPETHPNCLRLIAGEEPRQRGQGWLYVIQADVDDLAPEYAVPAQQALLDAGALDAVWVTVAMKKGRPGLRLEGLVAAGCLDAVLSALFTATTTIGVRYWPVMRSALERWEEVVTWKGQRVRIKVIRLPGGEMRRKPEFEDVATAARALGMAPHEARQALEAVLRSERLPG
jgi:pyridinium-3,5-bisthiocarboxylic acid mononucleotide nickel chelatase